MTQHQQLRLVNWRLKILYEAAAVPRSVASVCRRYGISRKTLSFLLQMEEALCRSR